MTKRDWNWFIPFLLSVLIALFMFNELSAQIQNQHLSVIAKKNSGGDSGPTELSGNLHTGTYGYENGSNPGIWANDVGGTTTVSVNSSDPIYGSYSIDAVMSVLSSMADRPILYFPVSSNLATSTSHTIKFSVRNNTANTVTFRFIYLAGLVNNTDIVLSGNTTYDLEITYTSSSTDFGYFGFYVYEGNSHLVDLTFDNVSIKEN